MIDIAPVRSRRDRREFIELPYRLYRNDPFWVPPLRSDVREMLDPNRHPFHRHSQVQLFLARRNGRTVGRIVAIHNVRHLQEHGDDVGFFGFFETVRDPDVAGALLEQAGAWLRERGLTTLRGPASFSSNEEWGLLVRGFDIPPSIMMPYNPSWYSELIEQAGFSPVKELFAYIADARTIPARLARAAETIANRNKITVRSLDMSRFDEEVERARGLYNTAWERNWGAVPLTEEEFAFQARKMKAVVEPTLIPFAYVKGELAGFALALPDLNIALARMGGRLLPIGWAKGLWYARRIDRLRVLALGVLPQFRKSGAAEALYLHLYHAAAPKRFVTGELSWILEENTVMRASLEKLGSVAYKSYMLFDRSLR